MRGQTTCKRFPKYRFYVNEAPVYEKEVNEKEGPLPI